MSTDSGNGTSGVLRKFLVTMKTERDGFTAKWDIEAVYFSFEDGWLIFADQADERKAAFFGPNLLAVIRQ